MPERSTRPLDGRGRLDAMVTKLRVLYWQFRNHGARYGLSKLVPMPMATTYGVLTEPIEDSTIITPEAARAFDGFTIGSVTWVREQWWQWRDRVYRSRCSPLAAA